MPHSERIEPFGSRTLALFGVFAVIGVVLRGWPRSALWLDEAQSVAFARLPLQAIPGALREDGAPPAYYLLLHGWMEVFGDGDASVRALSAVISLLALAALGVAANRLAGHEVALVAMVLFATNPIAIRYAAEARMYALVMLEVSAGLVAIQFALERPTVPRLAAASILTAALLYTHYWAMYLVATTLIMFAIAVTVRRGSGNASGRVAIAVLTGVVLWLPWVPTLLFQLQHTGTPWADPAGPMAVLKLFDPIAQQPQLLARFFGAALAAAFAVGLVQRAPRSQKHPTIRSIGVAGLVTVTLAVVGAMISGSAVSTRYTAVAVPMVLLAASAGLLRMPRRALVVGVLTVGGGGLVLAVGEAGTLRTQAGSVVAHLAAEADQGDIVVSCPDQLGPALQRLLHQQGIHDEVVHIVFPPEASPARVDWIDYAERYANARPRAFAADLLDELGPGETAWLVVSETYPPTQSACRRLRAAITDVRPPAWRLIQDDRSLDEHGALWRFDG